MKRFIYFVILSFVLFFAYKYRDDLLKIYDEYFVPIEKKVSKLEKNKYYRNYDFKYVQNVDNFLPNNKEDIKNIYYTVVNSGMEEFTFYCKSEYTSCIDDVNDIANDQNTISNINNFVHPFNSFKTLKTIVEGTGKITLQVEKVYDEEMIIILNYKVDEIIKNNITSEMDNKTKIKKIHDYIINNASYDKKRSDKKEINYKSDNAYGPLIEGYAICGGYTDAMMLFLERLGLKSIKISTENHIWNYVNIDDKWLHLDLTWDDPVTEDGKEILDDSYFLINDDMLKSIEKTEHNYDEEIYAQ